MVGPRFSPRTFQSWRLGLELRRLRESAGLTADQTAEELGYSRSRITRIETGEIKPRPGDVIELLNHYGVQVDEPRGKTLIELARGLRGRGWWQQLDAPAASYRTLIAFEAEADTERVVVPARVPGLLQTEAYATAIVVAGPEQIDEATVRELVDVRMKRQGVLRRTPRPLTLDVIVGEAAIRDLTGGREVMVEQLEHLVEASAARNVTVRVLPFTAGAHGASLGSHTLLRYDGLMIGSTETPTGHLFFDRATSLDRLTLTMDYLAERALSPEASVELIRQVVRDL